jgi:hypothetical protein
MRRSRGNVATMTRWKDPRLVLLMIAVVVTHTAATSPRLSDERMIFQARLAQPIPFPSSPPAHAWLRSTARTSTRRLSGTRLVWGRWVWRMMLERAQTNYGDIEMAFFPDVAPVTVAHILKLARLGAYNTNHFFRVMLPRLPPTPVR